MSERSMNFSLSPFSFLFKVRSLWEQLPVALSVCLVFYTLLVVKIDSLKIIGCACVRRGCLQIDRRPVLEISLCNKVGRVRSKEHLYSVQPKSLSISERTVWPLRYIYSPHKAIIISRQTRNIESITSEETPVGSIR